MGITEYLWLEEVPDIGPVVGERCHCIHLYKLHKSQKLENLLSIGHVLKVLKVSLRCTDFMYQKNSLIKPIQMEQTSYVSTYQMFMKPTYMFQIIDYINLKP